MAEASRGAATPRLLKRRPVAIEADHTATVGRERKRDAPGPGADVEHVPARERLGAEQRPEPIADAGGCAAQRAPPRLRRGGASVRGFGGRVGAPIFHQTT